jgi:hypothetical protein
MLLGFALGHSKEQRWPKLEDKQVELKETTVGRPLKRTLDHQSLDVEGAAGRRRRQKTTIRNNLAPANVPQGNSEGGSQGRSRSVDFL